MTDDLHASLSAAHTEALGVGDSPLRAGRLAGRLEGISETLGRSELDEDTRDRVRAAIGLAERVLRRDDDGREAARHLQAALALLKPRPRKPSPFLDDPE
ncbi:hypothetical protein BH23GEM8_BH23GEM8_16160 [soil metagenome]